MITLPDRYRARGTPYDDLLLHHLLVETIPPSLVTIDSFTHGTPKRGRTRQAMNTEQAQQHIEVYRYCYESTVSVEQHLEND